MGFTRRQQNIKIEKSRRHTEKWRAYTRNRQRRYHSENRDKENEYFKEHYAENKDYFRQKNKEHYKKNGDKWKAKRAAISKEWAFNKCSPTFVESTLESLGASLRTEKEITFSQCCSLIIALGYRLEDVTYPPFLNRLNYFNKKNPR